jgi:cyclophilin family peptidyl-prolyl cis-trans isomerase
MLSLLTLLASATALLSTATAAEQKQLQYMAEDWPVHPLRMTGEVVFTIEAPQLRGNRGKFDIKIGLFGLHVNYTALNFAQLAAGGILVTKEGGSTEVLSYRDTPFHRIEKDISIQGGDIVFQDGTGSITIYNASAIAAENYDLSNYGKGWVGMVHNGPEGGYSIGCQFYICMSNNRTVLHALNHQPFVVFGKVIEGFDKLQFINDRIGAKWNAIELDETIVPETGYPLNRPKPDIKIVDSRYVEYPGDKELTTTNTPSEGTLFGEWPKEELEKKQ